MLTELIVTQTCSLCHTPKLLSEFHRSRGHRSGHEPRCKPCRSIKGKPPTFTEDDIARFWSHVDKTPGQGPKGECWEWTAAPDKDGYGQFGGTGWALRAHRYSWLIAHPDETLASADHVAHRCDNPPCVRPVDLFKTDAAGNNQDKIEKGRHNAPRGESHHNCKVPDDVVRAIRTRYAKGGISQQNLADEFGLSQSYVKEIIHLEKRKYVN